MRTKAYSIKSGSDIKRDCNCISKCEWKIIKLEEFYICLFQREKQKQCDNFIMKSINHDIYLQKVRKSTLSVFDEKLKIKKESESE